MKTVKLVDELQKFRDNPSIYFPLKKLYDEYLHTERLKFGQLIAQCLPGTDIEVVIGDLVYHVKVSKK